jgi:hypothetical protein
VGWQAFVASLVHSLAWPAGVVAVVVVLRKSIRAVLSQALLRRLKAGPLEVEFDQIQAEVREDLARSPELTEAQVPAPASQAASPGNSLREELSTLAEVSPASAVMEASRRIEYRLTEMLDGPGEPSPRRMGTRALARLARERGLISDETLAALEGMSVLRNLVAHVRGDIDVDRARDYVALADAVMYALRAKPPAEHADQG